MVTQLEQRQSAAAASQTGPDSARTQPAVRGRHARVAADASHRAETPRPSGSRGRHARPETAEEAPKSPWEDELARRKAARRAGTPVAGSHASAVSKQEHAALQTQQTQPLNVREALAAKQQQEDAGQKAAGDTPPAQGSAPGVEEPAQQPASGSDAEKTKSVARSTAIMSLCTLASRVTGFVRTWTMAFALGSTVMAAGFSLANNLPNMIYELVAGGVLSTAFLPIYIQQRNLRGQREANRYASNLLSVTIVALGLIALLASIFAPQVMITQSLFSNAADETVEKAVWFFRFFAFQVVFYGISAVFGGLLNAEREFFWPAISSIFMNVISIVSFLGFRFLSDTSELAAMTWLAVGVTLSIAVMAFIQVPALLKTGFRFRFFIALDGPGLRETVKLALPAIATTAINLVALSFMNSCALNVSATGPAQVSYAWMWYQFPYGVLGVALSTALFTEMSEATSRKDWDSFKKSLVGGLRATWTLILPMAGLVFACAYQLIGLYAAGAFSADQITPIALLLQGWAVNLPIYAAYMFVYRAYSALKDMKTIALCNAVLTVGQVLLYMTFTGLFGSRWSFGLVGLALADIVFYTCMLSVLLFILNRRMKALGLRSLIAPVFKMACASIIGAAVAFVVGAYVSYPLPITGTLTAFANLMVSGLAGLAVILVAARVLGVRELSDAIAAVKRKLSR